MIDHSTMRLGKRAPVVDARVPHLGDRMMLIKPKPTVDWTQTVTAWPMLGNDKIGDCTAAAAFHLAQCWISNAQNSDWEPDDAAAIALYSATSQYPVHDDGAVETDVLRYWMTEGIPTPLGQEKIAYTTLKPQNLDELRLAVQWFGGVYLGVALPLSAQDQAVWDVVPNGAPTLIKPNSWGGHAVCAVAYDEKGFTVVTWGRLMSVTNAFMQQYCDEAYAVISKDWLEKTDISPPGLDWAALQTDMKAITA